MGAELLRSISAAPLPYGSVKGFGPRHPARARRKAPCGRRPKASLGGNRGRRWLCLDERDLWGFEDRGRKRATRHLPPQRHGRARMGAFLSIGRGAFFAPRGGECCDGLEARSRPSISWAARDVGERGLVKAEAAGGGGRRPAFKRICSPTTIAWRERGAEGMSVRGSLLRGVWRSVEARRGFRDREDLRRRRHETAPRAHRFGQVPGQPGTHALDR